MARAIKTKKKTTKVTIHTIRENRGKDLSPSWDNHENLSAAEFAKLFRDSMSYYNNTFAPKDLKVHVIKWMSQQGYDSSTIRNFKNTKDWRCGSTMGSIAQCLLKGMPTHRADFSNGIHIDQWLNDKILEVIEDGKNDIDEDDSDKPTLQERAREISNTMCIEIEDVIDEWHDNPKKFKSDIDVLAILNEKNANSSHAKYIKDHYSKDLLELEEVLIGNDEQLNEAYAQYTKKQITVLLDFYKKVVAACDVIIVEKGRKPRTKKPIDKTKLVSKMKYKLEEPAYKLKSIGPVDIIGCKELWVFNCKTRKLGKYVAQDESGLTVKSTSIIGFNETNSIQKTLRKPADQLVAFNKSGKLKIASFLNDINAVDTKLTGRISEDVILLKAI